MRMMRMMREMRMSRDRTEPPKRRSRLYDGRTGKPIAGLGDNAGGTYSVPQTGGTGATANAPGPQVGNLEPVTVSASAPWYTAVPWWAWALLGLVGGYVIARNYGHKIGRALAPAG
jgi:hypothetical protein